VLDGNEVSEAGSDFETPPYITCGTLGAEKIGVQSFGRNFKERNHSEELGADGIISKFSLRKYNGRA